VIAAQLLGFARRHWKAIAVGLVLLAMILRLAIVTGARDRAQDLADRRGALIEQSIDAVGAANGWPAGRRLKLEQLPLQIQHYGNLIREVRAARARALAEDLAHARAIEARDATTTKEHQDALSRKLADALRRADDYARRLRAGAGIGAGADSGGSGAADLPATADAAGAAAGAGGAAQLDAADIRICTRNTVIAEGWAQYWADAFADPR
jgi:hypothetical protein